MYCYLENANLATTSTERSNCSAYGTVYDAHKKYSVFVAVDERGEASPAIRVGHDREQYRQYLEGLPAGSQIALEAGGYYYWMVDDMEAAGHHPHLLSLA